MIGPLVARFASGLRYPTLFKLCAALFLVDLFLPDIVPFADEILLALLTLLVGALRKRPPVAPSPARGATSPASGSGNTPPPSAG